MKFFKQIQQFILSIKDVWKALWMSSARELVTQLQSVSSPCKGWTLQQEYRWHRHICTNMLRSAGGVPWRTFLKGDVTEESQKASLTPKFLVSSRNDEEGPTAQRAREVSRQKKQRVKASGRKDLACSRTGKEGLEPGELEQGWKQLRQPSVYADFDTGVKSLLFTLSSKRIQGFNKIPWLLCGEMNCKGIKLKQRD